MSARLRATCAAILSAALLWLGLSPLVAHLIYTRILLPRCREERTNSHLPNKPGIREIQFVSGGVHTLSGHVYTRANNQKLVIYYGGRRSNQVKNLIRVEALLGTGASVFTFNYRGFGDAEGHATVKSLLEDGLAAYDAAIQLGYTADQIVLYGESLGASVAAFVSSRRSCCGLILQSGFSTLEVQIKDMIPVLRIYPRCMFPKLRLSTSAGIEPGHPPLLIIHGDEDTVVDKKHSQWLAKSAGQNTQLVVLPGATHTGMHSREDWYSAVTEFLSSLETGSASGIL